MRNMANLLDITYTTRYFIINNATIKLRTLILINSILSRRNISTKDMYKSFSLEKICIIIMYI